VPYYTLLKDGMSLYTVFVGALLAFFTQRRISYLAALRALWKELNEAVQDAIQYTHLPAPTQEQFGATIKRLSITVDGIRSLFSNVGEDAGQRGLFPFEGVKTILCQVSQLGFGSSFDPERAPQARRKIIVEWKHVRDCILTDFDRATPIRPDLWGERQGVPRANE
jgi:hypothetical protein